MTTNIPYTYLIGWSNTNKFYYGVRYAKDCHPTDLFISYFTSSKHVKAYVKKHGNPDIIQIRKTFKTINEAIKWENRVLQKINARENKHFLNASNNSAPLPSKFDRIKNLNKWMAHLNEVGWENAIDKEKQERIRKKSSETMKQTWESGKANCKKPEDTTNYKLAANRRWANKEFRKNAKSRQWYHNDEVKKSKMLLPEEITPEWIKGRKYY